MSTTIKILIVEDEELYRLSLEAFLLELGYEILPSTDNSEAALELIAAEQPDLVLMDININGKLNGIEVANKIKPLKIPVLFITSEKEKAIYLQTKQTDSVGYLVKPFDEITLQSTIEFAITNIQHKNLKQAEFSGWTTDLVVKESVLIKHNNQLYKVLLDNIVFLQAKGKLCVLHTREKTLISNTSLSKFFTSLPPQKFVRIHKSYVANVKYIERII